MNAGMATKQKAGMRRESCVLAGRAPDMDRAYADRMRTVRIFCTRSLKMPD